MVAADAFRSVTHTDASDIEADDYDRHATDFLVYNSASAALVARSLLAF